MADSVKSRRHFELVRDGKNTRRVMNMLYVIENPELIWCEPDQIPASLISSRGLSKGGSLQFLVNFGVLTTHILYLSALARGEATESVCTFFCAVLSFSSLVRDATFRRTDQ